MIDLLLIYFSEPPLSQPLIFSFCQGFMTNLLRVRISSSSCFRMFFIIFICLVLQKFSPSLCDTENRQFNCAATSHCGNPSLILSYPFWGSTRPRYCGHPQFELNCSGEAPVLTIMSTSYRVINISYDSQALRLARMDYWNDVCPVSPANSTMDFNLFKYTDDTNTLTLFYDCVTSNKTATGTSLSSFSAFKNCGGTSIGIGNPTNPGDRGCSKQPDDNSTRNGTPPSDSSLRNQFPCLARNESVCFYELKTTRNSWTRPEWWECKTSVILPVLESAAESIGDYEAPSNLVSALQVGFGLRWLDNATCERCQRSGGACGSNSITGGFVCDCNTGSYPVECGKVPSSKPPRWIGVIAGIFGSLTAIIIMVIFIYYHRKRSLLSKQIEEIVRAYSTQIPKRYSYKEVKKMTKSFKVRIGGGTYGVVYKGRLLDGQQVAVKLLKKSKEDMKGFMNEVACISRTSHVNVIKLLGFCFEWNKRVLIYEFMPNGSLDKYISRKRPWENSNLLDWNKLYEIILGVARGLEYLHGGCNTKILHFDIKPHNILLDTDFRPKISDFGLSKQFKIKDQSHVSMTNPRGTPGFMAPEVFRPYLAKVSPKSDVYSFGMLILEVVGQKTSPNEDWSQSCEEMFPDWIYNDLQESNEKNEYWEKMTPEERTIIRKMIIVGLSCIQTMPPDRPSMSEVIEKLGRSLDSLEIPPKPSLNFPSTVAPQYLSLAS